MTVSPFDYVNAINHTKKSMIRGTDNEELAEKEYNPFIVNRALSYFQDTIFHANEMNRSSDLDKIMQFEFYLYSIRPKKRFGKWAKSIKSEDLDKVCRYYNCSKPRALEYMKILTKEQIESM